MEDSLLGDLGAIDDNLLGELLLLEVLDLYLGFGTSGVILGPWECDSERVGDIILLILSKEFIMASSLIFYL